MIRYSLVCADAHGFEAWFRDSLAFDDLSRGGHVACPQCGTSNVRKAMMAPSIRRRSTPPSVAENPAPPAPETEASPPVPMSGVPALDDDKSRAMRMLLRDMHAKVKATAENVGAAFPKEARRIHEGEEPQRSIYGTATNEEVRSLIEDGIGILPLPALPDDRN